MLIYILYHPGTKNNIYRPILVQLNTYGKRGLLERPLKPSKPGLRPQNQKPKEGAIPQGTLEYWDDKGDIT